MKTYIITVRTTLFDQFDDSPEERADLLRMMIEGGTFDPRDPGVAHWDVQEANTEAA